MNQHIRKLLNMKRLYIVLMACIVSIVIMMVALVAHKNLYEWSVAGLLPQQHRGTHEKRHTFLLWPQDVNERRSFVPFPMYHSVDLMIFKGGEGASHFLLHVRQPCSPPWGPYLLAVSLLYGMQDGNR